MECLFNRNESARKILKTRAISWSYVYLFFLNKQLLYSITEAPLFSGVKDRNVVTVVTVSFVLERGCHAFLLRATGHQGDPTFSTFLNQFLL